MVISLCASRVLIVTDSGLILCTYNNLTSLKHEELPWLPMLGYFTQTSEYHLIFMHAKDSTVALLAGMNRIIYSKTSHM